MHHKILEEASHEQIKAFLTEQLDELSRTMPELYCKMEQDLYKAVYGPHFTKWKYESAVAELENRNGTKGPHWQVQQVMDYAKAKGLLLTDYNEYDLAYVMNMLYSDYYGVVPDTTETYFGLTRAFLEDKDAPKGKAYLYYEAMCC